MKKAFPFILVGLWILVLVAMIKQGGSDYKQKQAQNISEKASTSKNQEKPFTKEEDAEEDLKQPPTPQDKINKSQDKLQNKEPANNLQQNHTKETKISYHNQPQKQKETNQANKTLVDNLPPQQPEEVPSIQYLRVFSPNNELLSGQQYQFRVQGYDQLGRSMSFRPEWFAEGGKIDSFGVYTAGDLPGKFYIVVTDPETQTTLKTYITIREQIRRIEIEGPQHTLKTGETCKLHAFVYNQADERVKARIKWYADEGKIDRYGNFLAGNRAGLFHITARVVNTTIKAKLYIKVEYRILPCPQCQTKGFIRRICHHCEGHGYRKEDKEKIDCFYCIQGYISHKCSTCSGTGYIKR